MTDDLVRRRRGQALVGRPPYATAEPLRCEALLQVGRPRMEVQCGLFVSWALPEVPLCHHHLSGSMVAVLDQREALWVERSREAWESVVRDVPWTSA